MKARIALLLAVCLTPVLAQTPPNPPGAGQPILGAIDLPALDQELQANGLRGWIHGAAPEFDQYVFTWRDPHDFFLHFEFPLITANPTLKAELAKLGRHDEVVVKGKFASLSAPIKHIRVQAITLKQKFTGGLKVPHYQREAKLPQDLVGKTELVGKVHAVVEDGKILVIEYKDAVVPVYVENNALTKDLYRNDKIRMRYVLRKHPNQPSHVEMDASAPHPLVVTERLVDLHGRPAVVEGILVLFPKSPQVKFNVFAIQSTDADGVKREHTLVNFDDIDAFQAILKKCQTLWDAAAATAVDGRNKYVNPKIKLRATGIHNVVDPGQANPQVLLRSEADLVALP